MTFVTLWVTKVMRRVGSRRVDSIGAVLAAYAARISPEDPLSGLEVGEVEEPNVPEGWVAVEVRAASLNHHDVWSLKGVGLPEERLPMILGCDAAGTDPDGNEVIVHSVIADPEWRGDESLDPRRTLLSEVHPGSLAERVAVPRRNLVPKPEALSFEEACCLPTAYLTAYRMLFGHQPHDLKPGQNVLVWGASGGLGSYAIQLINTAGANAIGVISDETKRDFVMGLGAKGVINRNEFKCWGQLPKVNSEEYNVWLKEARRFGKAIWDITGKGVSVDMVFEHPGEATFPVSSLVCKKGGMVVICAGTSGFNCTFDVRYMWMHQKRLQGSHFAHLKQAAAANKLMIERRLDPCMSEVFPWAEIPRAHMLMRKNQHKPGNMAVLVQAPRTGLRTFEDALEAGRKG